MKNIFHGYFSQAREFSQAPFWFWNDQLSEIEIARQFDDFQAHGIHAFVIHPRAGLPRHLGWMSKDLLQYMRFAIEEAARRDMWVILYDEAMYPSGSSAGQVVAENPGYACRGLVHVDLMTAIPGNTVQNVRITETGVALADNQTLVAEVIRKHDGHRIAIVDTPIGATIRGVHFVEDDPPRRNDHKEVEENHPLAGDLLNPEAMRCFIRLVYQRYYDEFGDHFGKTIKAIFTDEPNLTGREGLHGARPGTTGILEHVNAFLGYDFTPHLPALWEEKEPDAQKYRKDYQRAIRHRLQETYYKPISAWCQAHDIALTGHPEKSDDIGMLRNFQIPGQDIVLRYIEAGKESALVGPHSTMAKCASSAMLHMGCRRNLNEFAGAYGHELTFKEYRWLALWLLIRGCNMLSPHAFYYSIRGPRIDERPRDVGPNSPWWDRYKGFAEMTGKLCWLNTDSDHLCAVAILGQDARLPWESARVCFENQIDFNYIEDHHLCHDAIVEQDGLRIRSMKYDLLIVEEGFGPTLGASAERALARLAQTGRVIHWNSVDGSQSLLQAICQIAPPPVSIKPACSSLRIRQVRKESYDYLILFNEGESPFHGHITIEASTTGIQINMDTSQVRVWSPENELDLEPHGCIVFAYKTAKTERHMSGTNGHLDLPECCADSQRLPTHAAEHTLTEDGAWCWFQDPRAVFVEGKRKRTYAQWVTHDGRLQIGAYDHKTGQTEIHTLKERWGSDDHNVGAFMVLSDKRLFVFYAQHGDGKGLFCRTSTNPEDISQWGEEITISAGDGITYCHPVYLSDEKTFYVFWRGKNWKPTISTSTDGKFWSVSSTLLQDEGKKDVGIRPYTKIVSDGKSTIHLTFTDGHPQNESQNSVYYVCYADGNFFKADGSLIGNMNTLPIQHCQSDRVYDGSSKGRAWVWDIALDERGLPVIVYTRFPDETDHRYCYARWTGKEWLDTEITASGRWFPQTPEGKKESELYYSGGMALDHANPSLLYLSRQVDEIFELERWSTPDKGVTWHATPVTQKSKHLNVRPVVPQGYVGQTPHVLWMFGDYEHYTKFKTGIKLLHNQE